MMIILKRQDETSICCPSMKTKTSTEASVKRVELLIAVGLLIIGVWIIFVFR